MSYIFQMKVYFFTGNSRYDRNDVNEPFSFPQDNTNRVNLTVLLEDHNVTPEPEINTRFVFFGNGQKRGTACVTPNGNILVNYSIKRGVYLYRIQ